MDQLEENLASLEVDLPAYDIAALDDLTEPQFNYPTRILQYARTYGYGGLTINGETYPEAPHGRVTPDQIY